MEERIKLVDEVSGPARAGATAVKGLADSFTKVESTAKGAAAAMARAQARDSSGRFVAGVKQEIVQVERLGAAAEHAAASVAKMQAGGGGGGGLNGWLSVAAGNLAAGAASSVKDAALAAGQAALNAQAFKESTLAGLTIMLKSGSEAKRVWEDSFRLSRQLGASQAETMGGLQALLARGFALEGATGAINVMKAMADIKVIAPQANTDNLVTAIAQIKSKGKLALEELQGQLGEQFDVKAVLDELSKKLGKTNDEVRKLISAGKIDADTGILAVLDAVQKKTGKKLGGAAEEGANGLGKLIARLKESPTEFFAQLNASKGVDGLKTGLKGVLELLDPTTERGKKTAAAAETLANALGKAIGAAADPSNFDRLAKGVSTAADAFDALGKAADGATGPLEKWADKNLKAAGSAKGSAQILSDALKQYALGIAGGGLGGLGDIANIADQFKVAPGWLKTALIGAGAIDEAREVGAAAMAALTGGMSLDEARETGAAVMIALADGATGGMVSAIGAIGSVKDSIVAEVSRIDLSAEGAAVGASFVDGIVSALYAGVNPVGAAAAALARYGVDAAKAESKTNSPSKVWFDMAYGGWAAGATGGLESGARGVAQAAAGVANAAAGAASGGAGAPAGAGAPSFGGGFAGGSKTFAPVFHINVSGAGKSSAEVGAEIGNATAESFHKAVRRLAEGS